LFFEKCRNMLDLAAGGLIKGAKKQS